MTYRRWIPLSALGLLALAGCGSKGGGNLATVNGEPITLEQFHKYLEYKPQVQVVVGNGQVAQAQVAGSLGLMAMEDLLRQRLILQMAKDEGVAPTEQDVIKELEFQKKRTPDFVKELQARGLNLGEIRESLAVDIATERLYTKGITVDMAEVEKYIRDNKDQFFEPATVDMLWVFVRDEANKKNVDTELASGQAFAAVAKRYSQLPGAATNQRFPQRVVDALPKEIKDMVAKTPESQQSSWLKFTDGWAKFYVERKEARKPINMDDTRKEVLRRQIALERGRKASDLDQRLQERLKAAKIEVQYDDMKDLWKQAEKRLKDSAVEPKTATKASDETKAPASEANEKGLLPPPPTK